MKKFNFFAVILGLISGYASFFLNVNSRYFFSNGSNIRDLLEMFFIFPGLLFGIAVCLYFAFGLKKIDAARFIGFTLISVAAYNIAYWVTFFLALVIGGGSGKDSLSFIPFFVGGTVGAFLVLIAARWALVPMTFKEVFLFSLIGGVLALSVFIPTGATSNFEGEGGNVFLFIIWQAGMLYLIATKAQEKFDSQVATTQNL